MTIATETSILLQAAGDPALAALAVAGSTPGRLSVDSAHGELAKVVGGYTYDPAAGLRQAADIATGYLPGEVEWAKPPLLSNWTIEPLPGGPVQTVSRYYRVGSRWQEPAMRPLEIILRNSARCLHCGDEIESTHRHDFKWCQCGKLGVDGGHEYIRRIGSAGMGTSIVAVREIDAPEATVDAQDFVDQVTSVPRPTPFDFADAPMLQDWRLHMIEIARAPAPVLIGTVTGHPEFLDGTLMATTRLLAGNQRERWVQTTRRFYRLGDKHHEQ